MSSFTYRSASYPTGAGCYLMKNAAGQVIYVGKARNLRRRLGQYFQARQQNGKIAALAAAVAQIEVILVNTEVESLILENNLIKRYKPPFNVMLMSDHSGYTYIVQTEETFPRFVSYRKNRINKAFEKNQTLCIEKRFGPYLTREVCDLLLKCVNETFGIRTCDPMPRKVCFLYHLQRCSGPCEGVISAAEYARNVAQAADLLAAPHLHLITILTEKMQEAAQALAFERAQHLRDQIAALRTVFEKQVVERDILYDQDVVYQQDGGRVVLHLRRGALMTLEWLQDGLSLTAFLLRHYHQGAVPEVLVEDFAQAEEVQARLGQVSGGKVRLTRVNPQQTGPEADLMQIARKNHEYRRRASRQDDPPMVL